MTRSSASDEAPTGQKKVKLMIFLPSNRRLWTVVGKDHEYWVDPEAPFCSCKDFYFSSLSGGELCYHLKAVDLAKENLPQGDMPDGIQIIEFSDHEYTLVVKALASDAEKVLRD